MFNVNHFFKGFLVSSGAELLRRTLTGMSSKPNIRHSGQRTKSETTQLSHHNNPKVILCVLINIIQN